MLMLQVRSVFSQVIIAMAHHQYLAHEGGNMLIEFIVRQCGINTAITPKVICLFVCLFVCPILILNIKCGEAFITQLNLFLNHM